MTIRVYTHRFIGLPVTVHLQRDRRFRWTRIYGVQIGEWFIGAIKGRQYPEDETEVVE